MPNMYKHVMLLTFLNLKTSASHVEEHTHMSDEPLVNLQKDLFGNSIVKFDFNNKSWQYFTCILKGITDKNNEGIHIKAERAIKRRLKGTAKGIQVCYHDENNLIQHVIINFIESVEVS